MSNILLTISFWLAITAACLYLWASGGRDGKIGASYIAAAILLTATIHIIVQPAEAIVVVIFVDLFLLFAMLNLAMKSVHMWPIWFCGFHLLTVASHFSSLTSLSKMLEIFFNFSQFWAIPAIGAAVLGTYKDRKNSEMRHAMAGVGK